MQMRKISLVQDKLFAKAVTPVSGRVGIYALDGLAPEPMLTLRTEKRWSSVPCKHRLFLKRHKAF